MDHVVSPVRQPLRGVVRVPPSKTLMQRALVLSALSERPVRLDTGGVAPGEDVRFTESALEAFGAWRDERLGTSRAPRTVDLGWNGTGLRFVTAAACLRPTGARTLLRGRPALLRRPHRGLLRALRALGGHVRRRRSGAIRVIARPLRHGAVAVDGRQSSQFASALALIAPRVGGLELDVVGPVVSLPYLRISVGVLRAFGIGARLEETPARVRVSVAAGAPAHEGPYRVEPDASAAAAWFVAAAFVGGSQAVAGLRPGSPQADLAVLDLLARMGAVVDEDEHGWIRVTGSGERLRALGTVDLRDAPDLVPLVAAVAATAAGETRIVGAAHARKKESDRLARVAHLIGEMGGDARLTEIDVLVVRGTTLHGAALDVRDDHRLAFAFGVLGLRVPGVVLRGAESTSKSDPGFLEALRRAAMTDQ